MAEFGEFAQLERKTLAQVKPLNAAFSRVFGGIVPPISENQIHWIGMPQAEQIKKETGGGMVSWAMAYKGQIYFVKELTREHLKWGQSMKHPVFKDPLMLTIQAMAHENLHNACNSVDNGVQAKRVALVCWEAICGYMTDPSDDKDLPEDVREQYRQVNREIEALGDNLRVRTHGAYLMLGTPEHPLYGFGEQTDEDFIDLLAAITMIDYADNLIHFRNEAEREDARKIFWLLNGNNRMLHTPDFLMPQFEALKSFFNPEALHGRFSEAFFNGTFYEEYASSLTDEQMVYFGAWLAGGGTTELVELLLGKRKIE